MRAVSSVALAGLAAFVPTRAAAAEPAGDVDGPFELRVGPELMFAQTIISSREYSMAEQGEAYGGAVAGLVNAAGPLWIGLGASYLRTTSDTRHDTPTGPLTGWLLHVPALVEVGFRFDKPESRAIVGLEIGGLFGGFDNVAYSYTSDSEADVRGFFVGVRGGYVLSIADDFSVGATLGARAGVVDQTNVERDEYSNDDMLYMSLLFGLALHFQP